MKNSLYTGLILTTTVAGISGCSNLPAQAQAGKNVLFLIVDDLRPELNCYGAEYMHTPNIDKLAANSTQFNQAYCNIPVSGASRASLFTGLRPTNERWWDVNAEIDVEAPGVTTLPEHFKNKGYITISNSKVIHGKGDASRSWTELWEPESASATWRDYLTLNNQENEKKRNGPEAFEAADAEDNAYIDGKTVDKTILDLQKLSKSKEPFFMAVGIVKPHLPFNAPQKYWDIYPQESINLSETSSFDKSTLPQQAFHTWGELRYYRDIPAKDDVPEEVAKKLIRGYRAAVSYADAQIGKIIDELARLGLDKNTVVVLVGDHGWSLGDHNQWCKHSNFSIVNHVPMLVSIPQTEPKQIDQVVEFVDLYPTLCEAANLEIPLHTQGESMVKLIENNDSEWKNHALVKWHRGVTYITPQYRYTEWRNDKDKFINHMLFDVQSDPLETQNLISTPQGEELAKEFSKKIKMYRGEDFMEPIKKTSHEK